MSLFKRKAASPAGPPDFAPLELQDLARDIARNGWSAIDPGRGVALLILGELQRQIDELKGQAA